MRVDKFKQRDGIEYRVVADPIGNVAFREILFTRAGAVLPEHNHYFPHATVCVKGKVRVIQTKGDERKEQILTAPDRCEVRAMWNHRMESIDGPAEIWCTFAVRDEDFQVTYEPTEEQKKSRLSSEAFVKNV